MINVGDIGGKEGLWFGLSSETKPTPIVNSILIEGDTGKSFLANGSTWNESTNASYAGSSHSHAASAITSGTIDHARLGTGGGGSTKFLREDATWASPPGGSEAFPVGAVFIAVVSTNPGTLLGYGTWSAIAAGKMLVGLDSGDVDFDTAEETGGAKTKTIAQENLPNISTGAGTAHTHIQDSHNHTQNAHSHTVTSVGSAATGGTTNLTGASDTSSTTATAANATATNIATTATNQNESSHTHSLGGSGTALDVMNPYFVVYMWKRTA